MDDFLESLDELKPLRYGRDFKVSPLIWGHYAPRRERKAGRPRKKPKIAKRVIGKEPPTEHNGGEPKEEPKLYVVRTFADVVQEYTRREKRH